MSRAVAADVKATGRDRTVITKAGKRSFFSRVSEATLGTFPGHFWSVLLLLLLLLLLLVLLLFERFGHEIRWRFSVSSGVHHSSCCKLQSCKVEGFKATGRDRTVISKAAKREFFLGFQKQR